MSPLNGSIGANMAARTPASSAGSAPMSGSNPNGVPGGIARTQMDNLRSNGAVGAGPMANFPRNDMNGGTMAKGGPIAAPRPMQPLSTPRAPVQDSLKDVNRG